VEFKQAEKTMPVLMGVADSAFVVMITSIRL
jgi:hypothetical protein